MYKIERRPSGYILTFAGAIDKKEMLQWVEESRESLKSAPSQFGVIVDMRDLPPLPPESQEAMQEGQKLYKAAGMTRSCVVVKNSVTALQFKRIAKETGIYAWERYLDASEIADWQKTAVAWVKDGIDPDA
jgi:hypothetical protein